MIRVEISFTENRKLSVVPPVGSNFGSQKVDQFLLSQMGQELHCKHKCHKNLLMNCILTWESNSLLAFLTLSWLPFSRLFDPGGKCMYMSDMQGSK